jgi:predicted MFS family arabinose efflux permease
MELTGMQINKKIQIRFLDRNIRYSIIDGMFFSFMLGSATPYLGLYILRFNGSATLVNLITAVQPVISVIFTLLGTSFANSFYIKKALVVPASAIFRLFILVIALIPLLPARLHAIAFFSLWGIMYIPWAYSGLAWSSMMSNVIPDEQRGRFFGTRNACTGITTLLGTFIAGLVLGKFPFLPAFTGIFSVAFVCTMISLFFLIKTIEPVTAEPGQPKQIRSGNVGLVKLDLQSNLQTFKDPEHGRIFSLACLAVFIFHIGYSMAIPLYAIRQIQQLGFNNATVSLIATLSGVTALTGSYIGGLVSDRWGYRYVLLFSTLLALIPPLVWAFSTQLPWLVLTAMLWGFTGNAYMICFLYMVLAVSPFQNRSRFIGMNTVVGNLAGALGPICGSFLISIPAINVQGALICAALIMLAGTFVSFLLVKKTSI